MMAELAGVLEQPASKGSREVVIEARDLGRRFGSLVAVDGLNLEVCRGEVFGFVGPNGSGKSTSMRMLLGLLEPSAGSAQVLGCSIPGDIEKLRPRVGYMTQKFSLYDDLSIFENLEFAAEVFGLEGLRRRDRLAEVMEEFQLEERRDQRPATLSGGWRQRLALAAATVHEPELLFLDEPTAGVDPESRRLFWEKLFELAERGATILVSTHYMDEAVRCHRLCVFRPGCPAAVASPQRLTAALEDRVVELWGEPTGEVIKILRQRPEVASLTQLGNRVHTLLESGESALAALDPLVEHLAARDLEQPGGEVVEANLEDALVALSQGEEIAG